MLLGKFLEISKSSNISLSAFWVLGGGAGSRREIYLRLRPAAPAFRLPRAHRDFYSRPAVIETPRREGALASEKSRGAQSIAGTGRASTEADRAPCLRSRTTGTVSFGQRGGGIVPRRAALSARFERRAPLVFCLGFIPTTTAGQEKALFPRKLERARAWGAFKRGGASRFRRRAGTRGAAPARAGVGVEERERKNDWYRRVSDKPSFSIFIFFLLRSRNHRWQDLQEAKASLREGAPRRRVEDRRRVRTP